MDHARIKQPRKRKEKREKGKLQIIKFQDMDSRLVQKMCMKYREAGFYKGAR